MTRLPFSGNRGRSRVAPTWTRWIVEHRDYVPGRQFRDVQISGPFRRWEHAHRVIDEGGDACILEDEIDYELPLGPAGKLFGGGFVRDKLERLFAYRHAITIENVYAHPPRQAIGRRGARSSGGRAATFRRSRPASVPDCV